MRATLGVVVVMLGLVASVPAEAKKRPVCGDGSYVMEDAPLVPGDESLAHNGLVLRGGQLTAGGACPAVKAKLKGTKKGTRIAARWKSCTGVSGAVTFKGALPATCDTLTGHLKGRKAKLKREVDAAVTPAGAVTGIVRVTHTTEVPDALRADVLAQKAAIDATGRTVAADGATVSGPALGEGGWIVRVGDRATVTGADGFFTLTLDAAGPTEGELFRPGDSDAPVAAFWVVPHLAPAGGAPVPIDLEVRGHGACGMSEGFEPAGCAATALPVHHVHGGALLQPQVDPPSFHLGDLGTYPNGGQTLCRDQDGGLVPPGENPLTVLIAYAGSTCDLLSQSGCCGYELGTLTNLVKTVVGKVTGGFKPIPCIQNHRGRYCQEVLQGDVGAKVDAETINALPLLQKPQQLEKIVVPGQVVPVTVHNNACYGLTNVTKTVNDLGGTLAGTGLLAGPLGPGSQITHCNLAGTRCAYAADRALTWTAPPACPADATPDASDTYEFEADGHHVTVSFRMLCAPVTTTTTGTSGPTTTTISGRAVTLLFQTGTLAAGTQLCLSRITGGCVTPAHPPNCAYDHLHEHTGAGIGIDGDGPYPDPFDTMGVPCGYGEVVTIPGCGPDSLPACS